ncbi:MAG: T9SS type B sorting domain-containing protein, partial [Bacteroidales bacterium]|nr:T9SS type B sorting domain-containing protein [Bacteroidales bacterium]
YFSPNGDGINDHWIIGKLAEVYPGAVVNIYDRYGKLIVQYLGDNSEGWDGTYEGQPLPSTDYWYMVDIEEIEKQYSGHFTLMRR